MSEIGKTAGVLLSNSQLYHAIRIRLGLQFHDGARECLQCGKPIADVDRHLMACMAGGKRTTCHNAMVRALSLVLARLGCVVTNEVLPFAGDQKRMDIVATIACETFHIDVTIVSPDITVTSNPAVEKAAEAKNAKYKLLSASVGATFIPAAFDMWGNRCVEFGRRFDQIVSLADRIHPYLSYPLLAAHTAISVGLWASVGTLMTSRTAEIVTAGDPSA